MLAGFAMMGLVFTTDPTLGSTSRTWHGLLHDGFFVLLGLTLMPSMLVLGFVFRQKEQWKDLSIYTWSTVALAVPTFWLKGVAFYVFLLAILVWDEVIALTAAVNSNELTFEENFCIVLLFNAQGEENGSKTTNQAEKDFEQ